MKKIAFGILSAALIGGAQAAAAATLSYSDSFGMTSAATTDWTHTLNLSQFDSSLGTLQSELVTLTGLVEGEASAESLNASPSTVKLNLSAVISAITAGGVLVETLPIVSETYHFTAFDGSMDFAGTSGAASGTLAPRDTGMGPTPHNCSNPRLLTHTWSTGTLPLTASSAAMPRRCM